MAFWVFFFEKAKRKKKKKRKNGYFWILDYFVKLNIENKF